ncbi:putative MFS transporter [Talaromyces proteolyticus]|uniref:MFS transporter n=1 Tax=Talaromyces proteolyticus TaxID=1131652 RepID=A0AAD4PV58_9EURO|nr:putative MFS transporter [Talaromyces proteolyticus]KAH8690266.1 putative MFS transporter [Talaromyces proteolyticus]
MQATVPAKADEPDDHLDDNEDAPFLSGSSSPRSPRPQSQPSSSRRENHAFREKLRIRLMITLFAIILFVETGNAMTQGPQTRITESIACRNYYQETDPSQIGPDGQIPEEQCKNSVIQGEIAIVKGYMELFDGVASILLALPYGLLADRIGRKPTILLSIPGFLLNMAMMGIVLWWSDIFPLRAIWLSAIAWLFGGGLVVAAAVVWTMMTDVTTEAQRSAMFFQFGVAVMGSEFISNSIGSWLMLYNPWIPMLIGWGTVLVGVCLGLTLPETKNAFPSEVEQKPGEYELSGIHTDDDEESSASFHKPEEINSPRNSRWQQAVSGIKAYAFLLESKQVMLLCSAFLVYKLSRGTSWFLVQYVSVRYGWKLAAANMLVSLKSILMVALLLVVLPLASWYLQKKKGIDGRTKDLMLTKASVMCLFVGTLGMGLAPHVSVVIIFLIVQTMGAGFVYTTRAVVTTMLKREETARAYVMIEIIQAFGMIIASPTMTNFFNWGLKLGGVWTGLAWMVAAALFAVVGVIIWKVRLPPLPTTHED